MVTHFALAITFYLAITIFSAFILVKEQSSIADEGYIPLFQQLLLYTFLYGISYVGVVFTLVRNVSSAPSCTNAHSHNT